VGRKDRQVKVRGYRIEPGEVEARLRQHPDVEQVAVTVVRRGGDASLAACVVPVASALADALPLALREYLEARLPQFMVPSTFLTRAALPLNQNGKVDYAVLAREAEQSVTAPVETPAPPATPLESRIATIVADVLEIEHAAATTSFFDLGATSLQIVRIQRRVREALEREIPIVELFRHHSVRALAAFLENERDDSEMIDRIREISQKRKEHRRRRAPVDRRQL